MYIAMTDAPVIVPPAEGVRPARRSRRATKADHQQQREDIARVTEHASSIIIKNVLTGGKFRQQAKDIAAQRM